LSPLSVLIPEPTKADILHRDDEGQNSYDQFVQECLLPKSTKSVWDKMKKMKLKTFSTWMAKIRLRKILRLREERQLLAHFLVIKQSRPELVPQFPTTIGN